MIEIRDIFALCAIVFIAGLLIFSVYKMVR